MIPGIVAASRMRPEFVIVGVAPPTANLETYSASLSVSSGAAVTWSISGGALPSGLHLNASTGEISGVANASAGSYSVTVRAQDASAAAAEKSLSIAVSAKRDVVSLLHMDGASSSKSFPDATGKVWAVNGDAQITSANPPYGASSGLFDGSGDSLSITHNDFAIGGVDFTWQAKIRPAAATQTYHIIYDTRNTFGQQGMLVWMNSSRQLRAWVNTSGGDVFTEPNAVPLNEWSDIEVTRSGGTVRLFLRGQMAAGVQNGSGPLNEGRAFVAQTQEGGNNFNGQIKDLRLISGLALHTASYTPVNGPLPDPATALPIAVSGSLPSGAANAPYASTTDLLIAGVGTPFTCTVEAGALPAGWSAAVSGNAVTVSGPGVAAGLYTFTLKVTDATGNTAKLPLTLRIV